MPVDKSDVVSDQVSNQLLQYCMIKYKIINLKQKQVHVYERDSMPCNYIYKINYAIFLVLLH